MMHYCRRLTLTEHTTPIEGDLLALDKETIPFTGPDGRIYSYEALNMAGESFMFFTGDIERLIMDGVEGQEDRQEILEAIENLEDFLPKYYDVIMGYVCGELSEAMLCQSLYSDILTYDCDLGYI